MNAGWWMQGMLLIAFGVLAASFARFYERSAKLRYRFLSTIYGTGSALLALRMLWEVVR